MKGKGKEREKIMGRRRGQNSVGNKGKVGEIQTRRTEKEKQRETKRNEEKKEEENYFNTLLDEVLFSESKTFLLFLLEQHWLPVGILTRILIKEAVYSIRVSHLWFFVHVFVVLIRSTRHRRVKRSQIWNMRSQEIARREGMPVEGTVPLVFEDIREAAFHVSQSLGGIGDQELGDDVLEGLREGGRVVNFVQNNLLVTEKKKSREKKNKRKIKIINKRFFKKQFIHLNLHFHGLVVVERRPAVDHLEDQDAQRPVVYRIVVPFVENDLRGEIVRGAAHGPGKKKQ
jgi:hypothetical protein